MVYHSGMAGSIQLLLLSTIGAFLLWLGYTLFVKFGSGASSPERMQNRGPSGIPGAPKTCPVCSAKLVNGEKVKSSAFPSMGGSDRLMHVFGCPYCLIERDPRDRSCPVCGKILDPNGHLIARMFDKPGRSHVHVLGCTRCRGPRSGR